METNSLLSSSGMQQRKSSKNGKSKKSKPVRVVYISNPMKVKTSAAEFRALVQELTGQDAEFPDPSKLKLPPTAAAAEETEAAEDNENEHDHQVLEVGDVVQDSPKMMMMRDIEVVADSSSNELPESSGNSTALYEPSCSSFEDAFMPQMLESISGAFPAALLYHFPQ
ncbi:uncharacterized protein LOC107403959 [Ziziphus jujuba]|uniref:Uncharacterized protein LOC107403959 n=2 Tax=Ziziphus jujuba TaxID=326968 RepID=A0A6P3YVR6_ZIZJJ|nr:uncharacterized protein LOC107403959 [Ziziphus jujuba]KAH7511740.1 hypothetical protein FEM48_Zijuj12G0014900 [Ziziphus jujuba var. spinosa]